MVKEQIRERVGVDATCRRVMEGPTIGVDIAGRDCAVDVVAVVADRDETLKGRRAEGGMRKKKRMLVGRRRTKTP
jgi:hypothetical protein